LHDDFCVRYIINIRECHKPSGLWLRWPLKRCKDTNHQVLIKSKHNWL